MKMAELERFELSNGFHHYTLSKRAPSTARTQLRNLKQRGIVLAWEECVKQLILGFVGRTAFFEKLREKSGTLVVFHATHNGELMIKTLIFVQIIAQTDGATLGIIGTKDTL